MHGGRSVVSVVVIAFIRSDAVLTRHISFVTHQLRYTTNAYIPKCISPLPQFNFRIVSNVAKYEYSHHRCVYVYER